MLTRPGHEPGVRSSRAGPAVLVIGLVRSLRGVVPKKISSAGKIAATFPRADQIISRKGINHGEMTGITGEKISNHGEHGEHGGGQQKKIKKGTGNHFWG